jgi:hypothetical protein
MKGAHMSRLFVMLVTVSFLAGIGAVWPRNTFAQGLAGQGGKPAWADVFVSLGMYAVTYEKPLVGKGEKPQAYQQKAVYTWTGGRFEIIHVTLARDPAFKEKYSAEALKKDKNPPKELEINKKKAWDWTFPRQEGKFDQLTRRLVVMLDIDKAIIIDQFGAGLGLEEVAKKFDFSKVEKALANPPAK